MDQRGTGSTTVRGCKSGDFVVESLPWVILRVSWLVQLFVLQMPYSRLSLSRIGREQRGDDEDRWDAKSRQPSLALPAAEMNANSGPIPTGVIPRHLSLMARLLRRQLCRHRSCMPCQLCNDQKTRILLVIWSALVTQCCIDSFATSPFTNTRG